MLKNKLCEKIKRIRACVVNVFILVLLVSLRDVVLHLPAPAE